jgi:LPXTG-motif cell wall-anchored protein
VEPDPPRRRPRARAPAAPGEPPVAPETAREHAPARRRSPFGVVGWAALAVVAAVIVAAFATGTEDDLPWGAIIGVVVVLAFGYAVARRRAALRGDEDEAP